MNKVIVSVVGADRPGIIATVSRILFDRDCNLENVTQTIIQQQFSGIFIAVVPEEFDPAALQAELRDRAAPMGLHIHVRTLPPDPPEDAFADAEPFIITTKGPDRKGLVARVTEVIAGYGVNVANLQAVFKGGDDPDRNIMIYEVDVPPTTDQAALRAELRRVAAGLDLQISIQHRRVFEALNRI